FAIYVDRAAAHTAGDVGALGFAAHLADDHVLLGTPGVAPEANDLDGNSLGLGSAEYGPGGGLHARLHLGRFQDLARTGFWRRFPRGKRYRSRREGQENRGDSVGHFRLGCSVT